MRFQVFTDNEKSRSGERLLNSIVTDKPGSVSGVTTLSVIYLGRNSRSASIDLPVRLSFAGRNGPFHT
ncbi:MAG: hypothetical protein RL021_880 [Bacteroidota bacterium]